MTILRFDEEELIEGLARLSAPQRTIFAAASAERLFPAYEVFVHRTGRGSADELAAILDRLWLNIEGSQTDSTQEQADIDTCMRLFPEEEDTSRWVPEQTYAEDAVASLAYALRCRRTEQAQEAAWAARRAFEAVDEFVIATEGMDPAEDRTGEQILSHPLVQAELSRQRRDLCELDAGQSDLLLVATEMRRRSKIEGKAVFRPMSS